MQPKVYKNGSLPTKEVVPGYTGSFMHNDEMTVAFWQVLKDSILPEHHHPEKQVLIVRKGTYEITAGGTRHVLHEGDILEIPPDVPHGGIALTDCTLEDIFTPARPGLGK